MCVAGIIGADGEIVRFAGFEIRDALFRVFDNNKSGVCGTKQALI